MIGKIKETIEKHYMLDHGDTVVAAVSGGADSCALLSVLSDLAPIYSLKIVVAHFNHGLRGEASDADEEFCRNLSQKYGLIFVTEKMHQPSVPKGLSPENYFRQERYRFLDQVAVHYRADKIALGHHLSDQAETVLLNILRGSGLEGLKGFLPVRDKKYIRPFIEISRQEIDVFLRERQMSYCDDGSNHSTVYLRNRVRLELLPDLKAKYNPRIEQTLSRMAEIIRRDDECLNAFTASILASPYIHRNEKGISFSSEYFATLPQALGMRLIKTILESMSPGGIGLFSSHIQATADLIMKRPSGKKIILPFGLQVEKQYGRIMIGQAEIREIMDYEYFLDIPGMLDLQTRHIILSARRASVEEIDFTRQNMIYLDADRLQEPLSVRNRRRGDWFEPLGTKGRQKIKKLFIDRKVPVREREDIALLVDRESVIWIESMHLSERVKISPATKRVVAIEIKKPT